MFNAEIRKLLVQVISSWQVLAVTGVLVLYIFLVNYVARLYHRRNRAIVMPKIKKKKTGAAEEHDASLPPSDSEELNLEEEPKK